MYMPRHVLRVSNVMFGKNSMPDVCVFGHPGFHGRHSPYSINKFMLWLTAGERTIVSLGNSPRTFDE